MMSQTTRGAQAAEGQRGGVNPMQVGLGAQIGSIDNIHTQGFLQSTGRGLDLAIEGDGFFVVNGGEGDLYTRTGNFYLDDAGDIVDENGNYLLNANGGRMNIPQNAQSFSISENGTVNYVDQNGTTQQAGVVGLVNFANPEGLEKTGGNLYRATANSGNPALGAAGTGGRGTLAPGSLEMSNVDLAEEFTEMIVSQRGFQANTRIITTSDEILQELVNLKR